MGTFFLRLQECYYILVVSVWFYYSGAQMRHREVVLLYDKTHTSIHWLQVYAILMEWLVLNSKPQKSTLCLLGSYILCQPVTVLSQLSAAIGLQQLQSVYKGQSQDKKVLPVSMNPFIIASYTGWKNSGHLLSLDTSQAVTEHLSEVWVQFGLPSSQL